MLGDNAGQILDPNHASLLKVAAAGGRPPGYSLEDPVFIIFQLSFGMSAFYFA